MLKFSDRPTAEAFAEYHRNNSGKPYHVVVQGPWFYVLPEGETVTTITDKIKTFVGTDTGHEPAAIHWNPTSGPWKYKKPSKKPSELNVTFTHHTTELTLVSDPSKAVTVHTLLEYPKPDKDSLVEIEFEVSIPDYAKIEKDGFIWEGKTFKVVYAEAAYNGWTDAMHVKAEEVAKANFPPEGHTFVKLDPPKQIFSMPAYGMKPKFPPKITSPVALYGVKAWLPIYEETHDRWIIKTTAGVLTTVLKNKYPLEAVNGQVGLLVPLKWAKELSYI